MNRKPRYYSQHDPRWAEWPYEVPGEHDTISNSGCGPTCAAMLIETLTGKTYTPADACWWAREHGYKSKGGGTYYSYFEPQFRAVGLSCHMLPWSNAYGKPDHPNHAEARRLLKEGWYIIALMGPGRWTPGGHFVVMWWEDGKVRINDPNSRREDRTNGDPDVFFREAKFYWAVDAREYNGMTPKPIAPTAKPEKEEKDMTQSDFEAMYDKMMQETQDNDAAGWSQAARDWAIETGLIAGGDPMPDGKPNYMWESLLTCERMVQILYTYTGRQAKLVIDMAKQMLAEEGE